jgi:threonine/homoserine/homoserine lactone efflux protein
MLTAAVKGILLGLFLSISVGPNIFAIIKHGVNSGVKAGLSFVTGVSLSDIVLVVLCNFFATQFASSFNHQNIIALAGGVFLIALGSYTLFFKKVITGDNQTIELNKTSISGLIGIFLSGFFINTLNPSVFLFWFAWTSAITAEAATSTNPAQYKWIFFTCCLVFVLSSDILKVFLSEKLRAKLTPQYLRLLNKIAGLFLIGFGVVLLFVALK